MKKTILFLIIALITSMAHAVDEKNVLEITITQNGRATSYCSKRNCNSSSTSAEGKNKQCIKRILC